MAKWFLSTIGEDSGEAAKEYGLGLEIAEFCTAFNMDESFPQTDLEVRRKITGVDSRMFHAPFNELFPCAVDPKARELARQRYRQAIGLAKDYGAGKVVVHGGFHPWIYYPVWYTEQSILFWKDFLKEDPGVEIVLENVLEPEPEMILDIVKGVDDPRLRLCLDVGHINAYSQVPVLDWVRACAPWVGHFHLHNNDGSRDAHNALWEGSIPMERLLEKIGQWCPEASITLELMEDSSSVRWLKEKQFL